MTPAAYKEAMTPQAILRMFEQDFSERQAHDDRDMSYVPSAIHTTDDGHYEMPLPFCDQRIDMPCNMKLAETQLKKRFSKDPRYKRDYVALVEKMIEEGHAEKAPSKYKRAWFIPHHGVYQPKKPEKIPVVL